MSVLRRGFTACGAYTEVRKEMVFVILWNVLVAQLRIVGGLKIWAD